LRTEGPDKKESAGIALILVMLVIAITSALTFYLGSSVYFSARIHKSFIQRVQAEFLLKSTLNVARMLVSQANGNADPPKNSWSPLVQGIELPGELLGVNEPNVIVGLEMSSLDSKLSLRKLYDYSNGTPGDAHDLFLRWRDSFARLFKSLGFDGDNELVTQGPSKGTFFNSEALVANLIDYIDSDEESYKGEGSFAVGIESSLPKGTFANKQEIRSMSELESIPGFTSSRLKKLSPYVTSEQVDQANINLVSSKVLMAIAPDLSEASAAEIIAFARGPEGPYETFTSAELLSPYFSNFDEISKMLTVKSSHLQVVSKVQYGTSRYFLRATIDKSMAGVPGSEEQLPEVIKLELFG
jgi:type II secretory pathway component PulK